MVEMDLLDRELFAQFAQVLVYVLLRKSLDVCQKIFMN